MITSHELRKKYLQFFQEKGHAIIPSASLIPENDPTVLFTTAGMHPLVPYLLGEPHPGGKRLANAQKSIRTTDIDDVGDNRHLTFFEMLGNWSLGDYFKKEAIAWSFEFLTDTKWLGIDPKRLYVSVFAGDADAPEDKESISIWKEQFKRAGIVAEVCNLVLYRDPFSVIQRTGLDLVGQYRIFEYDKVKNWWGPAGETGPCGPDTEMFFDSGRPHDPKYGPVCHPNCDCGRFIEIWNDVFMEYTRTHADNNADSRGQYRYVPLKQKNVDTGMGLERTVAALNGSHDVFSIDTFQAIIQQIVHCTTASSPSPSDVDVHHSVMYMEFYTSNERAIRIIADHLRAATFIIGDPRGVAPSNVDQGYIVRRLIRRAVRYAKMIGIAKTFTADIAKAVIEQFREAYPELVQNKDRILTALQKEEQKFDRTLEKGLKEFEKIFRKKSAISGEDAFVLYSTYGFPLELSQELAQEKGQRIDEERFRAEFKKHQDLSRAGATQKFAGGLADHSWEVIRQHTATHLLDQALRDVLGNHVEQKGSNITKERLRFDFTHPQKMTDEEKQRVNDIVNEKIKEDLPVRYDMLTVAEAKAQKAIGLFEDKYATMGEKVKVYSIGDYSKEICGGPHVEHTAQVGKFKIVKEEAVSAGVRRIKAVVE